MKPPDEADVRDVSMERPHLVVLGAGASLAAFPSADRFGRRLPLMNNLVEVVGLGSLLEASDIAYRGRNFEELYGELATEPQHEKLCRQVEQSLFDYFAQLQLPEEPTLYDYLVLSLRSKDVVATFNWDPFLFHTAARNRDFAEPPHLLFLHGNVAVGFCVDDQRKGAAASACSVCGKSFQPSPLLYPVGKKNYSANPFIRSEWETVHDALQGAYVLTIFGYGAPSSDVEAIRLMKAAWGDVGARNLEEIEIIDILPADELRSRWRDFIHSHHYRTATSFGESWLARHPRRTTEVMWRMLMERDWPDDNWLPMNGGFDELYEWLEPLVKAEAAGPSKAMPLR